MMKETKKYTRTAIHRNLRVSPEFREKPDVELLARTLLAIAQKLENEEKAKIKGDAMT
ncbi:MAG: hypothetical protein LBC86_06345 [Oscillospiraceae bacterium]|jgi:hypothetical protein|nr:hypothetical protein [Oscillospiraceae bacterium]